MYYNAKNLKNTIVDLWELAECDSEDAIIKLQLLGIYNIRTFNDFCKKLDKIIESSVKNDICTTIKG